MIKDVLLLLAGALIGYIVQVLGEKIRHVGDDYELWADLRAVSLKAKSHNALADLEYRWRDKLVDNPHVVDVYFWSAGKRDITADMFGGNTVAFDLKVPLLGELTDGEYRHIAEGSFVASEDGKLTMHPMLIRHNGVYHARFVTDGRPTHHVRAEIANVEAIRSVSREKRFPTALNLRLSRIGGVVFKLAFSSFLIILAALVVWGWIWEVEAFSESFRDAGQGIIRAASVWGLPISLLSFLLGAFLRSRGSTISRRARRAVRELRKSLKDKRALVWLGV
ncbi:hypothetical protein [Leucobacter luti]|uniref:hypothetical protein n=1 Tax=Leucobacter luti TaxID=340320 RepID=UPI001C68B910|nr:hypothetical protein [Leucobacter luti]QYM76182.1 hypothetical protein K1X41_01440 [Leucobacter luti]